MEAAVVMLATVAAIVAWIATVERHRAGRAEGRARFLEGILAARKRATRVLADLLLPRPEK